MIVEVNADIEIELGEITLMSSADGRKGPRPVSGEIRSYIARDVCDGCGKPDCCSWDCVSDLPQQDAETEISERLMANGALDGVEAFLLALAMSGADVDMKAPPFAEAVATVMDAIGENDLGSVGKKS